MPKFIRKKENFICDNCKNSVIGNGYTNHCSKCLWSKHVDVNPGDRKNFCSGKMKPLGLESKSGDFKVAHQCQKCGYQSKTKLSPNDNIDLLISIQKKSF